MHLSVKRFPRKIGLIQVTLISISAALISLHLMTLPPTIQFFLSSATAATELLLYLKISQRYTEKTASAALFTITGVLAAFFPVEVLATLFTLSLFTLPALLTSQKLLALSLLSHSADIFSTVLAGTESEANPFMKFLMNYTGGVEALIVSKLFLIGLPVYWSVRSFQDWERDLFLYSVYCVGLAMAFRNLMIFFL